MTQRLTTNETFRGKVHAAHTDAPLGTGRRFRRDRGVSDEFGGEATTPEIPS